jgi:hypothetical protein
LSVVILFLVRTSLSAYSKFVLSSDTRVLPIISSVISPLNKKLFRSTADMRQKVLPIISSVISPLNKKLFLSTADMRKKVLESMSAPFLSFSIRLRAVCAEKIAAGQGLNW